MALAKEATVQMDTDEQDEEEREAELEALKKHRDALAKPRVKWVNENQIQADIQHTFETVDREVRLELPDFGKLR